MAKSEKGEKRRKAPRIPKQVATAIRAAEDKQALDLVVLDLRKAAGFTDYFVICTGTNARQIRAIADAITESLAELGVKPAVVEGYSLSEWILLDYFDFIVHVFMPETRAFYGLERLWGDAEERKGTPDEDSDDEDLDDENSEDEDSDETVAE